MPQINDLRAFIIDFNNAFPADREYRLKHNIAFNSITHRETCQLDIYLEWLESEIFKEHEITVLDRVRKKVLYDKGEWISENEMSEDDQSNLFDKIDLNNI